VNGVLTLISDITEYKQSEEKIRSLLLEKEILLKEIHHRIKNNMFVLRSLLSMQSESLDVPEAVRALKDAISRIESMEVLYDKLYLTENYQDVSIKDYLTQLVHEIIAIFPENKSIQIEMKIDDFIIGTKIIFPLGIMINELLTNAIITNVFP
jgi:two-component sensor histidine kinase